MFPSPMIPQRGNVPTVFQYSYSRPLWIEYPSLMEFRCQHCGHRIVLNAPPAAHEVECPSCRKVMKLPEPSPAAPPNHHPTRHHENSHRSSQKKLQRIFDPIPRPFTYLVGGAFVLLVLAPFWIYLLKERYDRRRPVFSDDAGSIP